MMKIFTLLFFLQTPKCFGELDPENFILHGFGIDQPDLIFPARYFYVQLVDLAGSKVSDDYGDDFIKARTGGEAVDGSNCRVQARVLNTHDGSYTIQYRISQVCKYIAIELKTKNGDMVAFEPIIITGQESEFIYPEECGCAPQEFVEWKTKMKCPSSYEQIKSDLRYWQDAKINFDLVLKEAEVRYFPHENTKFVCHYALLDNQLYGECYGIYKKFKHYIESMLLSLLRKIKFPDMHFLFNLADFPVERLNLSQTPLPVFSWTASKGSIDIVLPTYDLVARTLEILGKEQVTCGLTKPPDVQEASSLSRLPWKKRKNTAYWRGRDSSKYRLKLKSISDINPHLIDAKLTYFASKENEALHGPKVEMDSFDENFKHKYVISLDGMVAAYRLPYLMSGGATILKQESAYYEHFYRDLKAYKHYVPIKRNLTNLVDQILWLKTNEAAAEKMAGNAKLFAVNNLQPNHVFCYYASALMEYSWLLNTTETCGSKKRVLPKIEQPGINCECRR